MSTAVARRKLETKSENQRKRIVELEEQRAEAHEDLLKAEEEIASLKDEIAYQKRQNKKLKGKK